MTSPSILRDTVSSDAPIRANTFRNNDGKAVFNNENYRIRVSDDGEVLITNKKTGETYKVWGDPHVQVDGKQAFDFWGTTTFKLQDGTTVTIETTPWKGGGKDGEATISSKVTITDGDYAAVIRGVDDNQIGDRRFTEHHGNGVMVDARTDDGNVIYENHRGAGFLTQEGRAVDQAYIDSTDLIKSASSKGDGSTAAPAAADTVREPNTVSKDGDHVVFRNENYRIRVSDDGEVVITNKKTGETYRVWGDPHVQVDGKDAFDFWGTTTFKLQDGTTVTIETTPWKGGGKDGVATISSKVTISDGDYATVIRGVDDNNTGDLRFTEHHGRGVMVDARTDDGNVIYENHRGAGFLTREGRAVDQAYIDSTDLIKSDDSSQSAARHDLMFVYALPFQMFAIEPPESSDGRQYFAGLPVFSLEA